jgi:hypothetical protein
MMGVVNTMSLWSASLMYPRNTIYGVTGTIYINDPVIITEMGLRFFVFEKCAESFNSFRKILGLGVSFWGKFSLPRYTVRDSHHACLLLRPSTEGIQRQTASAPDPFWEMHRPLPIASSGA